MKPSKFLSAPPPAQFWVKINKVRLDVPIVSMAKATSTLSEGLTSKK